jgi:hypothetical protein
MPSYKRPLLRLKSLGGIDKSGKRLSLKSGYHLESWKPLWKFSLLIILSFSKKPLNMSMPSTFVITINLSSYRQKCHLDQIRQFHVLWYKLSHLLLSNVYWTSLKTIHSYLMHCMLPLWLTSSYEDNTIHEQPNHFLQCKNFDLEMEILYICIDNIRFDYFTTFFFIYYWNSNGKAHNMFTLMFDPWYKNFDCIKELWVGSWSRFLFFSIIKKIMIPFFMRANWFLNHVGGNNNSQVGKICCRFYFWCYCVN